MTIGERGAELTAAFRGDGFLRGMVRSICGLLADIGRGRFPPERLREILETGDRRLLAQKVPARGRRSRGSSIRRGRGKITP